MSYTASVSLFCILVIFLYNVVLGWARSTRRRLLLKQTSVGDLGHLGKTRQGKLPGTAVVCGGSIAGLVTARVCSDHFERVIIIEPEAWLNSSQGRICEAWNQQQSRSRVIQYNQNQSTQVLNYLALRKLFPTFDKECKVSDLRVLPAETKTAFGGYLPLPPSCDYGGIPPKSVYGSRRGFETLMRRLVLGDNRYPNIEQITGFVTGMIPDPDNPSRVSKVALRSESGKVINIDASFVIDCTGPAHLALKWLKTAGYGTSTSADDKSSMLDALRVLYDQKMKVVTLRFKIPISLVDRLPVPDGFKNVATIYNCLADWTLDNQNIYVQRVDGDFVQVLCCNWDGPKPPQTLDGAIEFARAMRTNCPMPDWFFEFLDMLHEVENTMTFSYVRVPPYSYVRYHRAVNLPNNWIAIGDSVMKINPADGQGCSKATIGAATLNTLLHRISPEMHADSYDHFNAFSKEFFQAQNDKIEPFWSGTKLIDYAYETTDPVPGERLSDGWWLRWYLHGLNRASTYDVEIASALWHVNMMLAPSIDIFQPKFLVRVLWEALRMNLSS